MGLKITIFDIAKIAHEANRAYCDVIGDRKMPAWEDCPDWQKDSCINGVAFFVDQYNYSLGWPAPNQSHDNWLRKKKADGWKYGPVKDEGKREHPCVLPFEELPPEQQYKDYLFAAIVQCMLRDFTPGGIKI